MSSSLQPRGLQNARLLCPPLPPRVCYTPLSSLPNGKTSSSWYLPQLSQVIYLLSLFSALTTLLMIYTSYGETWFLCLAPLPGNMSHGKRGLCPSSSYSACLTQSLSGRHYQGPTHFPIFLSNRIPIFEKHSPPQAWFPLKLRCHVTWLGPMRSKSNSTGWFSRKSRCFPDKGSQVTVGLWPFTFNCPYPLFPPGTSDSTPWGGATILWQRRWKKNHTGESLASFWKDLESSRTSLNSCDSLGLYLLGLVVRCKNQSPVCLIYRLGFCCSVLSRFSRVRLFVILWTIAHQAAGSMGFSRQEYWSGLPCPPTGDLPDSGIKPTSLMSPALVGGKPGFCNIWLNAILQVISWHMFSEFWCCNQMAISVPAQPRPLGPLWTSNAGCMRA